MQKNPQFLQNNPPLFQYDKKSSGTIPLTEEIKEDLKRFVNKEIPDSEIKFYSYWGKVFQLNKYPHLIFKLISPVDALVQHQRIVNARKFLTDHQLESLLLPSATFCQIESKKREKCHFIVEAFIDILPLQCQEELYLMYEDKLRLQIAEFVKFIIAFHLVKITPRNFPLKFEDSGEIKFVLRDLNSIDPRFNGVLCDPELGTGLISFFSPRLSGLIIDMVRQEGQYISKKVELAVKSKVRETYAARVNWMNYYRENNIKTDQTIQVNLKHLGLNLDKKFRMTTLDTDSSVPAVSHSDHLSSKIIKKIITLEEMIQFFINAINTSIALNAPLLQGQPRFFASIRTLSIRKYDSEYSPYIRLGGGVVYKKILDTLKKKKYIFDWTEGEFVDQIKT